MSLEESRELARFGYMCLTDYDWELAEARHPSCIWASIESLKEDRPCVEECGIVKVKIVCVEIIQEPDFSKTEQTPKRQ